jgi:aminopeptidase C
MGGHAMLITGVYRSKSGRVLGYRIQNSWGPEVGKIGYYYMDRDYFDIYVNRVTFALSVGSLEKPQASQAKMPTLLKSP